MLIPRPIALSFAILTLTPLQPADELVFEPQEGASLTRTFREKTELTLESAVMTRDGEEDVADDLELEVTNEREVALIDEVQKIADGRILSLARTYETLDAHTFESATEGGREPEPMESRGSSELEGAKVLFEWDETDEEYAARYDEDSEDHDEDFLEGLEAEVDLGGFLPEGEVSPGDSWEIEPEILAAILRPGGDLTHGLDPIEGRGEQELVILCFCFCLAECGEELEGEVALEYEGRRETDDGELAVISFTVELTSERNVLDSMRTLAERMEVDMPELEEMEEVSVEIELEGKGELLWNVEAGRAHSLELEGELELSFSTTIPRGPVEATMELQFVGTTEVTVEVTSD